MKSLYQTPMIGNTPYTCKIDSINTPFLNHCHNELEILLCVKGKLLIKVCDRTFLLNKNCGIIINSFSEHEIISSDESENSILIIEFGYAFLGKDYIKIAEKKFTEIYFELDKIENSEFGISKNIKETFIDIIEKEIKMQNDSYIGTFKSWMQISNLYKLSAYIYTDINIKDNQNLEYIKRINNFFKISPLFEYISVNFANEISIDNAANIVGYEKKSFCRIFKEITGSTFHSYLNYYRIENAKKLLINSRISVFEVATNVGYSSSKTFCRLFKEHSGMTPLEYRKLQVKL